MHARTADMGRGEFPRRWRCQAATPGQEDIYKDVHVNTLLFIFSVLLPKVEELVEESRKLILWGDMVLGGRGGHGPRGTPASSS